MARAFALTIHLHDGRYHGSEEWPPAPARAFQALVAGAAQGRHLPTNAARALTLLEELPPPVVAAPFARHGQRLSMFVPNNDLDAFDGDPGRVDKVRVKKSVRPHLLEADGSFLYAWPLPDAGGHDLAALADGLYQFGRGIDAGWSVGELLDEAQLASRLHEHRGTVHHPTAGEGSTPLAVPTRGSLQSILSRHEATLNRLRHCSDGQTEFVQPPKARFDMVRYSGTPPFHVFELRSEDNPDRSSPWPLRRATALIEHLRDAAVDALSRALPGRKADIERVLIGRRVDGTNAGPIRERVRFVPLPSIGHEHADHSIRRVLVQVPPGPLAEADVLWALAGRRLLNAATGEVDDTTLAASTVDEMTKRYRRPSRIWASVTPLALGSAPRRRIDPIRQPDEAKPAMEREAEQRIAQRSVAQALRHAGVRSSLVRARVQREPFEPHGTRAESFAAGTRFPKESLWHVELELDRGITGPLVLGDGRFLGLGVMAPKVQHDIFALTLEEGLPPDVSLSRLARALRRAVMARAQAIIGPRSPLPSYFHGHDCDDAAPDDKSRAHIAFSVDAASARLLIVPPHVLERQTRPGRDARIHLETLERALEDLTVLRVKGMGALHLRSTPVLPEDPLLRPSRVFTSESDYVVTRHAKRMSAVEAVLIDVRRECDRRGLPRPTDIRVTSVRGVAGVGVVARIELTFAVAVPGPLLLGKTRYLGGGLLAPAW